MEKDITVLFVHSGENPEVRTIKNELSEMQKAVDGPIEEIMPYDDGTALICNEEGKIEGLDLNRAIYDENGKLQDIIAGDFFICGTSPDSGYFRSLNGSQLKEYSEKFRDPEYFLLTDSGIKAIKYPKEKEQKTEDIER